MNDESLDELERQIATTPTAGSPIELRHAVLNIVSRELTAARWDRRLGRVAALLLVVGSALNVGVAWRSNERREVSPIIGRTTVVHVRPHQQLIEAVGAVAQVTDAATASLLARHLLIMTDGEPLSPAEAAVMEKAANAGMSIGPKE